MSTIKQFPSFLCWVLFVWLEVTGRQAYGLFHKPSSKTTLAVRVPTSRQNCLWSKQSSPPMTQPKQQPNLVQVLPLRGGFMDTAEFSTIVATGFGLLGAMEIVASMLVIQQKGITTNELLRGHLMHQSGIALLTTSTAAIAQVYKFLNFVSVPTPRCKEENFPLSKTVAYMAIAWILEILYTMISISIVGTRRGHYLDNNKNIHYAVFLMLGHSFIAYLALMSSHAHAQTAAKVYALLHGTHAVTMIFAPKIAWRWFFGLHCLPSDNDDDLLRAMITLGCHLAYGATYLGVQGYYPDLHPVVVHLFSYAVRVGLSGAETYT